MNSSEISRQRSRVKVLIERLQSGDVNARDELIAVASDRMLALTRKIKADYRRVSRWEQTDDIFQRAAIKLHQTLAAVEINDVEHFWSLTAQQIRWTLVDVSRKYYGKYGVGRNHASVAGSTTFSNDEQSESVVLDPAEITGDVKTMDAWTEFHELIDKLPEAERKVVDLIWYHGMSQQDAAEVLDIGERTLRRLWRSARFKLHEMCGEAIPLT